MRRTALWAALAAVWLAGCGGSRHHTSPIETASTTGTSDSTQIAPPSSTASPTTSTTSTTASTATTSTNPPPSTGSTGPRLPATFVIGHGENINPPLVSAPSKTPILLTMVSGDGKPHSVLVRTAPPHTLHVPAGGRASLLLTGLPDGRYVLDVDDGATDGTLQVGVEPGP